jgi:hypothetical protein
MLRRLQLSEGYKLTEEGTCGLGIRAIVPTRGTAHIIAAGSSDLPPPAASGKIPLGKAVTFSKRVSGRFRERSLVIGVVLVPDGHGQHISKGYIYFAMGALSSAKRLSLAHTGDVS